MGSAKNPLKQRQTELMLLTDILRYYAAKPLDGRGAKFNPALTYASDYFSKLSKGDIKLPAGTLIKLPELKKSLEPTLACLNRAAALTEECDKQKKQLKEKQKAILAIKSTTTAPLPTPVNPFAVLGVNSPGQPVAQTLSPKAQRIERLHFDALNKLSTQVLCDFDNHERVLIPVASNIKEENTPNAQMLCEFRKAENGNLLFLVWNTGLGAAAHISKETLEKDKQHAPVRVFRCAKHQDIDKNNLKKFIEICLATHLPNHDGKAHVEAKQYNNHIISQITYLSGVEIDSAPFYHTNIIAQEQGSSAWKVIETYIQNTALKPENTDEVQYEILKHSLEALLKKFEADIKQFVPLQEELEQIASLFALKLQQVASQAYFSVERQKAGMDLIVKAKQLISEKAAPQPIETQRQSQFRDLLAANRPITITDGHWTDFRPVNHDSLQEPNADDFTVDKLPTINNLDQANSAMQKLLDNAKPQGSSLKTIKQFEALLKALPLTDDFVNQPHNIHASDFSLTLQKFMSKYMDECKGANRIPYGERQIAVYSGIALLELITNKYFANRNNILENLYAEYDNKPAFQQLMSGLPALSHPLLQYMNLLPENDKESLPARHKAFEYVLRSHYFTATDSGTHERLKQIKAVFRRKPSVHKDYKHITLDLIANEDQALRRASGFTGKTENDKKEVANYFITNIARAKTQFPDTYRDTSLCLSYGKLASSVINFIGGRNYLGAGVSLQENWNTVYPHRDDKRKLHSHHVNYNFFNSNEIEKSHPLEDEKIKSDFQINLATSKYKRIEKVTANNIQIKLHAKSIDKKLDLRRILSQIGATADSQIVCAIEFLQANATNMDQKDVQKILFMLLFDKGLMAQEMKENPAAIAKLLDIIESAMKFYSHDEVKQPFAFYSQINTFLRKILVQLKQDTKDFDPLFTKTETLCRLTEKYLQPLSSKAKKSEHQALLVKDLQAIKVIELSTQLALHGKLTLTQLTEFYEINFGLRFAKELAAYPFMNKEVDYALHDIKTYAIANPALTTEKMMLNVVESIDVDFDVKKFNYKFPHVTSGDTQVDLIQAKIIHKKAKSTPLPKEVYADETFKEIFGNDDILVTSLSMSQHEFQYKNESFKLQFDHGYYYHGGIAIQKKLAKGNEAPKWYQLVISHKANGNRNHRSYNPFSASIFNFSDNRSSNLSHSDMSSVLPGRLINDQHWIWQSQDSDVIIIDKKTNRQKMVYSKAEQAAYFLDENGTPERKLLSRSLLTAQQSDLDFLSAFESPEFIEVSENLRTHNIHIHLPRYGLRFTSRMINGAQYFINDDDHETCLVKSNQTPVAGFGKALVLANIPHGHQPQKLVKSLIARAVGKDEQADKFVSKHYATYYHAGAEVEPASAADAFYLALLHQASSDMKKGHELLSANAHRFMGSANELESLLALAATGNQQTPQAKSTKALCCYTIVQYLRQGHTINSIIDRLNQKDEASETNAKIAKGLLDFKPLALNVIKEYLVMKDYIPTSMRLKRREELAIIDYVKQAQANFYLDIQSKKKQLKNLVKEYHSLVRISGAQAASVKDRINSLKNIIEKEYHFVPKLEKLEPHQYDMTKRDGYSATHNQNAVETIAINDLSIQTSTERFNASYMELFHEAANDPIKEAKLHAFLDAKLLSEIHKNRKTNTSDDTLKLTDQQIEEMVLPDFLANLIKSLDGVKLPDMFSLPEEAVTYALLKGMIANKKKVHDIIRQFERAGANSHVKVTNGLNEARYLYNVDEAIAYAVSHQSIQFHVPSKKAQDGKAVGIQFVKNIPEIKYVKDRTASKTPLKDLDTLLSGIGLKETLLRKEQTKVKESSAIFAHGSHKTKEPFYESLIDESNKDYQKGRADNQNQDTLQQQWFTALSTHATCQRLQATINGELNAHQAKFAELQKSIVTLLNQGPKDPKAQLQWQLALQAKTRNQFTLKDAFKAFDKGSLNSLKDKCHLEEADAKKLFQLTSQYLNEGTQQQQYQRILALLEKLAAADLSATNQKTLINQLGAELTLRRCYDINKYPNILLFEYLDNKMVYPNQVSMLDKLLKQKGDGSYESVAIQLIMGGGKSKVLLPLLAKMRANGTNLTIIEVPGALLETNFYDLHGVSAKLNQNAHLLKFDRNIDADSQYFYRMRQHLHSVIANKEYLVTTRESIQSIELKYIDVLTNPIDDLVEWEKQINYLDEIVNLIKNQGDAILDEIDLNLRTKDQLIYTVGEGKPSPKFIIESIVDLYKSFTQVNHVVNGTKLNLHDVATLKSEKPNEDDLQKMFVKLQDHLLTNKQSPIARLVKELKPEQIKEVKSFLSNDFTVIPACINAMSLADKSILAVYKEHLNRLLPLSLTRKLHENFGLTQDSLKVGMASEIAIPYVSNNTPNESAKFQNHLLTMNYTIQTHLAQSLSKDVVEATLKDFKSRLLAEKNLNAYAKKPTSQVETIFKSLFGDAVDLGALDINDKAKLSTIYEQHKNTLKLKEHCLAEYILPAVLSNPLTICSNDQNHVSAYRSVVGFTGTDYNYRCFHDSISRDNTESFGTDGKTISHLMNKERKTHVLDQNNSNVLFTLLENHQSLNNVRAIIDVGAQFKGVTNRDVANRLATFYFNHPAVDIKNVLYFNKDNVLCALKVNEHPEHEEPLVLGSSDNIAGKLGCESSQYFTYYDQAHTTGTDIKQEPGTIGIVTVSEKSMLRDVLQAVMRLRDLKDSHSVEFAVMQSLSKEQSNINIWDVKTILNVCLQYQAKTLMQEHLGAVFNKINNIVRQDVLAQIRNATSIMGKVILSDAYKQMLYQFDNTTYFDKYGVPESMIETETFLNIAQDKAIDLWKSCLANAQKKTDAKVLGQISGDIKKVIAMSVKICAQKQKSPLNSSSENQVIAQIEVQNERQAETEIEAQAQDAKLKERKYKSWAKVDLNKYKPGSSISLMSFESIANSHRVPRSWKFDSDLQVSENFYNTLNSEYSDKLNRFKKPLFYVMSVQIGSKLTKILITQSEAKELRDKLKQGTLPKDRQIWIDTPSGIPYAGIAPDQKTKHPNEGRLREQIQFYNADTVYLAANYGSLTWFKEDAEAKMNYLQSELLVLHPSKGASIALLKEIMTQDGKIKPSVERDNNLLTDKSWQRLHDAYLYPNDDKQPVHSKAEFARLQAYAKHREKVGFFSMTAKWQALKKAVASFVSRAKRAMLKKAIKFGLQHITASTFDYIRSKAFKLAIYGAISSVISIACTAGWYFGFGFVSYLKYGSMIGAAALAARAVWSLYAKTNYNSLTKIENITHSSELYALKTGVGSGTYLGYLKSMVKPTAYLYPKAYYAGLEIGCASNEVVLNDAIKRKTI